MARERTDLIEENRNLISGSAAAATLAQPLSSKSVLRAGGGCQLEGLVKGELIYNKMQTTVAVVRHFFPAGSEETTTHCVAAVQRREQTLK